ncbi:MAG: sulfatase/phosphatase domain-containing protein, partial [Verrucomicrobiota bacterium]
GIRLPLIIRQPGRKNPGAVQSAMVTWADITPTLLDAAGALPAKPAIPFHGRSFAAGLDGVALSDRDEIYASHTMHEVTMYYPMRVVRTRRYKLIHNLANSLTYPFALDLIQSPTWIGVQRSGSDRYGKRLIKDFLHRPPFELYDLETDPDEINNLADSPAHAKTKAELVAKLKTFQTATQDPWIHKWTYE